jgi:hypothetical protein
VYTQELFDAEEDSVLTPRLTRWLPGLVLLVLVAAPVRGWAFQAAAQPAAGRAPQPTAAQLAVQLASEEDRQKMLELLHITSLGDPVNPRTPEGQPHAANYDESKANPFPKLPDPLVLKNGKRVTAARTWWNQRRPEIVEDFDREVYGRVPKVTPKVKWEVTRTTRELDGDVPVVTKQLAGHVDNSSYPQIAADIQLTQLPHHH